MNFWTELGAPRHTGRDDWAAAKPEKAITAMVEYFMFAVEFLIELVLY